MEEKYYKEGILNAIKILDDEVQSLRSLRDTSNTDGSKEYYTNIMLSHITSIMHLKEIISDGEEEN